MEFNAGWGTRMDCGYAWGGGMVAADDEEEKEEEWNMSQRKYYHVHVRCGAMLCDERRLRRGHDF